MASENVPSTPTKSSQDGVSNRLQQQVEGEEDGEGRTELLKPPSEGRKAMGSAETLRAKVVPVSDGNCKSHGEVDE